MEIFLSGVVAGMILLFLAVFRLSDGGCRSWIGGQIHPAHLPDLVKALYQTIDSYKELSDSRARTIEILKDNTRSLEGIIETQTRMMKAAGLPVGPPIVKLDD